MNLDIKISLCYYIKGILRDFNNYIIRCEKNENQKTGSR